MATTRRNFLRSAALVAAAPALLSPREVAALPVGSPAWALALDAQAQARSGAGPVLLSRNENPYGMNPKAKLALEAAFAEHNRYASPQAGALRKAFAQVAGVPEDHVLLTQGSREALALCVAAFGLGGKEIVTPFPTYEEVPRFGAALGLTVQKVPLTDSLTMDLQAMEARIGPKTGLVFACNPQNPTGTLLPGAALREFVLAASARVPVLVDEAYHDYADDPSYASMLDLVRAGKEVIVTRTASKIHALAGLRVGFAVARPALLKRMAQFQTGFLNPLSCAAATASLADPAYTRWCAAQNKAGRDLTLAGLGKLGLRAVPSQTNFVFFDARRPHAEAKQALELAGFLVGRAFPPYDTWVRVSIGTPDEMKAFLAALPQALKA